MIQSRLVHCLRKYVIVRVHVGRLCIEDYTLSPDLGAPNLDSDWLNARSSPSSPVNRVVSACGSVGLFALLTLFRARTSAVPLLFDPAFELPV